VVANLQIPNLAYTAGIFDVRYAILMPVNVLRGAVTLMRMRGSIHCYFDVTNVGAVNGDTGAFMSMTMQLVPVRDGAIVDLSVLNPINSADLESNRILWRRDYFPSLVVTGGLLDGQRVLSQLGDTEIDVKSKRRFDRANWALVLSVSLATFVNNQHRIGLSLRGLFLATDGL